MGALAVALAVALVMLWPRAVDRPLVRLDVDLGAGVSLGSQAGADVILSPDGTRLVYASQGRLFTRKLDQPKATALAGTEGANGPFFSPDGQWIAFFAQSKLKKISVEGGAPIALCDASAGSGGSCGEDGDIIAALTISGGLSRIPSAGGAPAPVIERDRARGEFTHRWPQILPGGKAVLFTSHTGPRGFDGANIDVVTLGDHSRKTLVRGGTYGRYLPSGHLVYVSQGTLFAVPFDIDTLAVRGTPSPVLEHVAYNLAEGSAQVDFSRTGTLIYRSAGAGSGLVTVQWLDSAGKTQPLLAKPGLYQHPRLSPDGRRLALLVTEGTNRYTWVYESQRDTMTRLTFEGGAYPLWSPDGRNIVFTGGEGLSWTRAHGAGKPQPLTQGTRGGLAFSFTPDGKRLAYLQSDARGAYHIWTVPLEIDGAGLRAGKPEVFRQSSFDERHPSFSSDGRWLAYSSNESGTFEVYVRAFPDKGGKWQVSNAGGVYPLFSRGGRELFFRTEDNQIMVASYAVKGDSFVADKPRVWSEKRIGDTGLNVNYDLAPDGKRIAALMPAAGLEGEQAQNHVIFLQNFFDEVRRRVPVSGK